MRDRRLEALMKLRAITTLRHDDPATKDRFLAIERAAKREFDERIERIERSERPTPEHMMMFVG